MNIGMNLGSINTYTPDWTFVDVMKHARMWNLPMPVAKTKDTDLFPMDENGWITSLQPGQVADTIIYVGSQGHFPVGTYTCTYEGNGTLVIGRQTIISNKPNKIIFNVVNPGPGIEVKITKTDPANYIRNIKIIMPGFEDSYRLQIFHPLFLERLKPFTTLRFMDWSVVNGAVPETWDTRTKPEFYTQSFPTCNRPVAYEYMIDLCNRLEKDMWINISHQVDDTYIANLARLLHDTLHPNLKVYVEYSNEAWNTAFRQNSEMMARGLELGFGKTANPRLPINSYQASLNYYSFRSVQMFTIFSSVFEQERLVRVLASQCAAAPLKTVSMLQEAYKSCDALAVAPYFHFAHGIITKDSTVDDVFAACSTAVDNAIIRIKQVKAFADTLGKPLVAYEGGESMVGDQHSPDKDAIVGLYIQMSRDPRMYDLYKRYLKGWQDAGGGLFNAFDYIGLPSQWGNWGALEYQDQPLEEAHKYRALTETNN